jgi:hypothetical protein
VRVKIDDAGKIIIIMGGFWLSLRVNHQFHLNFMDSLTIYKILNYNFRWAWILLLIFTENITDSLYLFQQGVF